MPRLCLVQRAARNGLHELYARPLQDFSSAVGVKDRLGWARGLENACARFCQCNRAGPRYEVRFKTRR